MTKKITIDGKEIYLKTKKEVGRGMEKIRNDLGITQAFFAKIIHCSPQMYTHVKEGNIYPNYLMLNCLHQRGIKIKELFKNGR